MSRENQQSTHILVADDEAIVLSLISDALEDEGFVVESASSGAEALELIRKSPFDLIISDIRMPGMSGIDMVAHARELQPGVGVIFMTGYADLNSAKNAIKQGAFDYIMKPFELSEMRQAVKNAIRARREAEEQSSDRQLTHLSDLNQMLFATGDRKSLIISSLKFAMMHMRAQQGSALFWDTDENQHVMVSVVNDRVSERVLASEPLAETMHLVDPAQFRQPFVVATPEDHPVYRHDDPVRR
jgi:YesN/AraC family two-component response regulator